MWEVSATTEMSWLSREIHLMTCSVIFVAMSLSRGYLSFLLKVSASVYCFGVFACIAGVNLFSLSVLFFYLPYQSIKYHLVSTAALLFPLTKWLYCRCYMSQLDNFHFVLQVISTLQTFYPQVCRVTLHTRPSSATNCALTLKQKKSGLGPRSKLQIPDQWKNAHIGIPRYFCLLFLHFI